MIKAEWTNADALNLQPTCNQLATDTISRQAAIDAINKYACNTQRIYEAIKTLPSAQPYTEAEIQKMQELEQAELQKAYECGRASAQPEIIHCGDCKHWDKTWTNDWAKDYHYCPVVDGVRKVNFYCADAERRTDDKR